MSNTEKFLPLKLELIWWVFTIIVITAILIPILSSIEHYPFLYLNILFIIVFITLTRYVFLLRHTFLAKQQWLKAILIFASIPFIFFLIHQLNEFQTFLDEEGIEGIIGNGFSMNSRNRLSSFIRNEMLLFGVGSIIIAIIFPFRMLMSVWLTRNRGRA